MLYRMFGNERAWRIFSAMHGNNMLWRQRSIFVTNSKDLVQGVEKIFIELVRADVLSERVPTSRSRLELRDNLPLKYSELKDEHFPLFITFDCVSFHLLVNT